MALFTAVHKKMVGSHHSNFNHFSSRDECVSELNASLKKQDDAFKCDPENNNPARNFDDFLIIENYQNVEESQEDWSI